MLSDGLHSATLNPSRVMYMYMYMLEIEGVVN